MTTQYRKTTALLLCALFTALVAVGAFIRIPVPLVPFTLQFWFTTMAGLLLGASLGSAQCVGLCAAGLGRGAGIHPRRGTGLCIPAHLRLSVGVYRRHLADRQNRLGKAGA